MQKKTMIFVIIAVSIFFVLFVIQSKKTPQIVDITPSQEAVKDDITPENVEAETTTEELATVPMDAVYEEDVMEKNNDQNNGIEEVNSNEGSSEQDLVS